MEGIEKWTTVKTRKTISQKVQLSANQFKCSAIQWLREEETVACVNWPQNKEHEGFEKNMEEVLMMLQFQGSKEQQKQTWCGLNRNKERPWCEQG